MNEDVKERGEGRGKRSVYVNSRTSKKGSEEKYTFRTKELGKAGAQLGNFEKGAQVYL